MLQTLHFFKVVLPILEAITHLPTLLLYFLYFLLSFCYLFLHIAYRPLDPLLRNCACLFLQQLYFVPKLPNHSVVALYIPLSVLSDIGLMGPSQWFGRVGRIGGAIGVISDSEVFVLEGGEFSEEVGVLLLDLVIGEEEIFGGTSDPFIPHLVARTLRTRRFTDLR
jgi:hypothetical protein